MVVLRVTGFDLIQDRITEPDQQQVIFKRPLRAMRIQYPQICRKQWKSMGFQRNMIISNRGFCRYIYIHNFVGIYIYIYTCYTHIYIYTHVIYIYTCYIYIYMLYIYTYYIYIYTYYIYTCYIYIYDTIYIYTYMIWYIYRYV